MPGDKCRAWGCLPVAKRKNCTPSSRSPCPVRALGMASAACPTPDWLLFCAAGAARSATRSTRARSAKRRSRPSETRAGPSTRGFRAQRPLGGAPARAPPGFWRRRLAWLSLHQVASGATGSPALAWLAACTTDSPAHLGGLAAAQGGECRLACRAPRLPELCSDCVQVLVVAELVQLHECKAVWRAATTAPSSERRSTCPQRHSPATAAAAQHFCEVRVCVV